MQLLQAKFNDIPSPQKWNESRGQLEPDLNHDRSFHLHTFKKGRTVPSFLYLLSDLHNCLPIILGCLAMTGITHLILYNKFHHKNLL